MVWPILSRRFLGAVFLLFALGITPGCIWSQMQAGSDRPVGSTMEVIVHSAIEPHLMETAGLFPADLPPQMAGASERVSAIFEARLVQGRPFRTIRQLPYPVKSDAEALWYGKQEQCDLVILPAVVYLMDGSGAMPTRLVVRTRILDVRSGRVLWDILQNACSEPGADIDLTWTTISGEPAQRYPVLTDRAALLFVDFLVRPLEQRKNAEPAKRPPVSALRLPN